MSDSIVLRPGRTSLADWRALYHGGRLELDPLCRADVEAGAAALQTLTAQPEAGAEESLPPNLPEESDPADASEESDLDEPPEEDSGPSSDSVREGEPFAPSIVRLILALKLASLGQGASGASWSTIGLLGECLSRNLLPVIPSRGPAPGTGDADPLVYVAAALSGRGEMAGDNGPLPSGDALRAAGLAPLDPDSADTRALASGTQICTAFALAGLFEAERLFQSALVIGGLSAAALKAKIAGLSAQLQRLRRHPSQIEVASALRSMLDGGSGRNGADEGFLSEQPEFLGVCLDLLRQAGQSLAAEANGVSEVPVVLWQTGETIAGVNPRSAQVALAAELIAMALTRIGSVSERRFKALSARATIEAAQFPQPEAEARRAEAGLDEDRFLDTAITRRLLPTAGRTTLTLVRELLAAMGDRDGATFPPALERVRTLFAERSSAFDDIGSAASVLVAAAEFIRSGELAAATGLELPILEKKQTPLSSRMAQRAAPPARQPLRREPARTDSDGDIPQARG